MPTTDTVTGNRLSSSTSIQNGTLPKMPGTLGHAGVSHSRTIIESVVTEDTEHTSVFPLEEPKPTSMFPGSTLSSLCYSHGSGIAFRAFLQDVEPKMKSISLSISAWLHPLPTLGRYCKPYYQDNKLSETAGSGSLYGSEGSHPGGGESI